MLLDVLLGGRLDIIDVIIRIISSLIVIFLTMPVHEYAHAFAAYKLGDNSQKYMGRLTLNPFAHIDWFGALCIILVGFGWAKPVQVNPYSFRMQKRDMAITALAGPLSNLVVAFVAVFLQNLMFYLVYTAQSLVFYYIAIVFQYIAIINISLAVFNLIPVPPLDGSKILAIVLPDRLYYKLMQYERYIYFAVIILVFSGILDGPMYFARSYIFGAFSNVTALPFRLLI